MSAAVISGRRLVYLMGVFGVLLAATILWLFQYSRRELARAADLPERRDGMRLVPLGKYEVGPDHTPVVWPAFYIDEQPQTAGKDWAEARETCAARGRRLPVPVELEKASSLNLIERNVSQWEWLEDPRKPFKGEVRAFGDRLTPPAVREEQWVGVKGGADVRASRIYPARYRANDLVFRCALTPK